MAKDARLQTVEEWHEYGTKEGGAQYVLPLDLSPRPCEREGEKHLLEDYPVEMPEIPYTRYGSSLERYVASRFCRMVDAEELGFEARLTSSGMSAIQLAIRAAGKTSFVAGKVLYGLTPEELSDLQETYGVEVKFVDSVSLDDILGAMNDLRRRKTLFFETIGNGVPMPVLPFEALLERVWNRPDVTFILDNTFLTCALFNPFEVYKKFKRKRGEPAFTFVYLESLSKYYRADPHFDPTHGGVIIAPRHFMREVIDPRLERGYIMSLPSLLTFPVDLFMAPRIVMKTLSLNGRVAANHLRVHPRVGKDNVWYPDTHPDMGRGAGGVLYFNLPGEERGVGKRIFEETIPFRASFGHAESTHIDFGEFGADLPGLIRLAVGTNEKWTEVVEKLEACLGPIDID